MQDTDTTVIVLAVHVLLFLSIGLNISILRQCVGFIYLTFISGFVILKALNLSERGIVTLLLSVALSIAFDMFMGLVINEIGPSFGFNSPLLADPAAIIMASLTLAIFLLTQRKHIVNDFKNGEAKPLFEQLDKGFIICVLAVLIFSLGSIGALLANTNMLIIAIAGTAIIFATCVFSKKVLRPKYYTFVLFFVSLGLIYQTTLLTSHIMGWDIFNEYYVFKQTSAANLWTPPGQVLSFSVVSNYNSQLSLTILPTLYVNFLSVNGDLVFKIIYPFIFAFVPIILYKTFESSFGKSIAILAAFFFIANPTNFYGLEPLSLGREMIGYLFFAMAIYTLLSKDMTDQKRKILFVTFSAGLAVSAYSLSFIYAFFIIFTYVAMLVTKIKKPTLDLALVVTVLAILFIWYMFIAAPPLNKLGFVVGNILRNFTQDMFSSQARLGGQYNLLSPTAQTSFLGGFYKLLIYLTQGLIVVGALVVAMKPKIVKVGSEYRWMAVCTCAILIISLAIPNLAPAINFSRFYKATMVILSPLYAIGGLFVFDFIKKARFTQNLREFTSKGLSMLLLALILSAFFLFSSGFVNYVSGGYPTSYPLNFSQVQTSYAVRTELFGVYIPELDIYSAKWLGTQINSNSTIYADEMGAATLFDYTGNISQNDIYPLLNSTQPKPDSYIYMREFNTLNGVISYDLTGSYPPYNVSNLSPIIALNDKIYSNGQSEIFYSPK